MIICGFEKFSMVDYADKICCTVFTGGCNFRCPFCHNGSLVIGDVTANRIDENKVFDYLEKRRGLVDAVSVTGGEATLQPDLDVFFRRVRELGYLTKLDTNGLNPSVLERLLAENLLDYVAMDIKNSPEKYPLTTGLKSVDMDKINESMRLIKESETDGEFRTTLIEEFHTADDMREIADWVCGAKRYYIQNYKDSEGCIEHGYHPVPKSRAEEYLLMFKDKVRITGLRGFD